MVTQEQKQHYKELSKERKQLHKKSSKQTKLFMIICLLFGAVLGLSLGALDNNSDIEGKRGIDQYLLYFYGVLVFYIIYFLHIIIHEAGHLIFGLLTGYKFLSFRIFSAVFYKNNGQIKRRKYSIKGTAGQCLMYPPKRRADGTFPFALYNLGGGLNNLIFSIPFVILAIITEKNNLRIIYLIVIAAGILTAVTNLIPMVIGLPNDGMNLKSMLKDKNMQDAFYLQLQVNAELSDGKQFTEYAQEMFELPENSKSTNALMASVQLCSYYWQLANRDYDSAERILSMMEEKANRYVPIILNMIEVERLFLMVLRHAPLEEIASIYAYSNRVLAAAKTSVDMQRIRYVYETFLTEEEKKDVITLIKGKRPKKWKECDREKLYNDFLKVAENYPISGEAALHVDIVNYIRNN